MKARARGVPSRRNCKRDPGLIPLSLVTCSEKTSGVAGCAETAPGKAVNVKAAGSQQEAEPPRGCVAVFS